MEERQENKIGAGVVARVLGLAVIVVVFFAVIITSISSKPSNAEIVWDTEMTMGNMDAKNYFIIYSDIVCPYCVAFENAMVENEEQLRKYIEQNDILIEVRMSDYLYEYGEARAISSRYSALGAYCAKKEGKFWDYYNLAITTVWNDYFKTQGKSAFAELNQQGKEYWEKIGQKVGLVDEFVGCMEEESVISEMEENAAKMVKLASGMPYFKFNSWTANGFDLAGGWDDVLMYFAAGLEAKK